MKLQSLRSITLLVLGVWSGGQFCVAPACAKDDSKQAKQSASRGAIVKVIDTQRDAWNRGDLEAFLTGYYQSPDTSYTSGGQEFWGYDSLRTKYTNSYGTSRDTMGTLNFTDLKVIDVTKNSAYCVGHWHLERKDKPLAEGVFTLVFKRTSSGWKIIHDHTTSGIKKPA